MSPEHNNRRIARNTVFLYFRMMLTIGISLYTSRVVLEQLGVNDYGIYSVVGGVVMMFSILSSSLSSAVGRFITYELGKENPERLKVIFSTSVIILLGLGLVIAVLLETAGVWFLNNRMNINPTRMTAANWVLQCSTATFLINMLSVPYNAVIIAHERMQAFAYIGILEALLKLGVAFMLFIPLFDSLIVYAVMLMITSGIIRLIYGVYCKRHFEECHLDYSFDRSAFKEMLGYSSWNFIGSSSAILKDQGVNVIINIFCGTALNAARAIAVQVNTAIFGFAQSFMLAVNPQIIKSYAAGDTKYMYDLAFRSTRLSVYLLLCLSCPIILEMPYVLGIWLTSVPAYSVSFARLTLILAISEALSIPLQYMNQASGKIRNYQLAVGGIQMLNFPISYILLRAHISPNSVYVLAIILSQVCLAVRLIILHHTIGLPVKCFLTTVYTRITAVVAVCVLIAVSIAAISVHTAISPIFDICVMLLATAAACYLIGCRQTERDFIKTKLSELYKKLKAYHA